MSESEAEADPGTEAEVAVDAEAPAVDLSEGPVVLFDGVCNFCSWSVNFAHGRDDGRIRFAPLQSAVGTALLREQGLDADYFDSLVYVGTDGSVHTKSDGVVEILRHMDPPWQWLRAGRYLPRVVRDAMYDAFAAVRYRLFGKKESCMVPSPELRARFLETSDGDERGAAGEDLADSAGPTASGG
jgi:predicted DCC family thiol-disulfide oxidoreductase YuxK